MRITPFMLALSLWGCSGPTQPDDVDTSTDTETTEDTDDDGVVPDDTDDPGSDTDDGTDTDDTDDTGDLPDDPPVTAVRLMSLVPGFGDFDVYLDGDTTPIATGLSYRETTDFLNLEAGTLTFAVRAAGTPAALPPVLQVDVELAEFSNLLVVAWPNLPGFGGDGSADPVLTDVVDLTANPGEIRARVATMFFGDSLDRTLGTDDLGRWRSGVLRSGAIGSEHVLPNGGGYVGLSSDYEANVTAFEVPATMADEAVLVLPPMQPGDTPTAVTSSGQVDVSAAPEEGELFVVNLAYDATSPFVTHTYTVTALGENALSSPPNQPTDLPLATDVTAGAAAGPAVLDDGRQWIRVRRDVDVETDDITFIDNASGTRSAYVLNGDSFFEGTLVPLPGGFLRPASGQVRVSVVGQTAYEDRTVWLPSPSGRTCAGWHRRVLTDTDAVWNSAEDHLPADLDLRIDVDGTVYAFDLSTLAADTLHLLAQRNDQIVAVAEDGAAVTVTGTVSADPCLP
jgi:hypothetical protein